MLFSCTTAALSLLSLSLPLSLSLSLSLSRVQQQYEVRYKWLNECLLFFFVHAWCTASKLQLAASLPVAPSIIPVGSRRITPMPLPSRGLFPSRWWLLLSVGGDCSVFCHTARLSSKAQDTRSPKRKRRVELSKPWLTVKYF